MAPRLPTARTSASGDVREMLGPARGLIGPASIDAVILSYRNQLGFKGGQSVLMVLKSNTLPVKFQSIQDTSKPIPKTSRGTLRESVKFSVERRPPQLSKDCSHTIRST
ncbi:hypothetical protein Pst134EB_002037 [Puccinia striiformis f. sp. tritici]|nr:hypothetical protein Pst134EB_002037 [Puccinia striiformis f. sp. tritici]